ncbi:hypothetical protein HYG81_22790 (plasmid) [Natrinema zhouii]|uniref:hypothetical protein n=1 Tax=Natrinema zhouii TaxID=1710539 RepID=UPI001CFFDD1B|nr:hypothetical protein [Natrinema zhouii]UHQ98784.1 hypothetical protein HYG81_22790 [Natrinema zhouii]
MLRPVEIRPGVIKTAANDWDDLLDSTEVTLIGASMAEAILQPPRDANGPMRVAAS